MRIIRYLKNCKVAVLLIVCLLVVQAFTDLALPHYTSDIVDVGIQQSRRGACGHRRDDGQDP